MFRILLVLAVIAVGYDAIVNHGTYTRQTWDGVVGMSQSVIGGAKHLGGEIRKEATQRSN